MSSDNADGGSGKRSYNPIPEAIEHAILKALAANIRAHANRRYDDVREQPQFAPWIGRAAGATGKKKFRRLVDKIAKPMLADHTKPHRGRDINDEQQVWAHEQLAERRLSTPGALPVSVGHVMAGGLPTLRGLDRIERLLETSVVDIERVRQAALVDDPHAPEGKAAEIPELLLKAVGRANETVELTLRFYERFTRVVSDRDFYVDFMRYLREVLGDDVKFEEVLRGYRQLVQLHGGLPTGEA